MAEFRYLTILRRPGTPRLLPMLTASSARRYVG